MAVGQIQFGAGHALNKMTAATVIWPEGRPGPFPVFYLLHGLSDDHTAWVRRTSVERYVDGLPLIVVMPDGGRGFYTDAKSKPNAAHETAIVRDLVSFVDRNFRTIPGREGRVVGGLSMGGYGALKLALKYPGLFRAAASHSGAVGFASRRYRATVEWDREWLPVVGPDPRGSDDDLFALAKRIHRDRLPALRIDCGRDDFLIEDNRRFHRHLARLKIPHAYVENPGAHTWDYWDREVRAALAFFRPLLGI